MSGDWITSSTLATFGGSVFVVTLIAQFLKGYLDRITHVPTRVLVLVIAWAVLFGRRSLLYGDFAVNGLFLDWLNGFLVALTAMGVHSVARDNLRWK